MRVAVDGRRLQDSPLGGVGRYVANLLPHLAPAVDLVVLTDARRPGAPVDSPQVALSVPGRLPGTAWLHLSAGRWLRRHPSLFHGTFNAVPRHRWPSVVSLYDLSFEDHPEDFSPAKRKLFRAEARHAARVAGRVLTVSRFSQAAIIDRYQMAPHQVLVAPAAVDPMFGPDRRDSAGAVLAALGVDPPYVVALGGAPRRGLAVAVEAWSRARAQGVDTRLVTVGRERVAPCPGLVQAGPLDDRDWSALLAGAAAFCYPTRYEGFGLPALEAVASGTPVVCARVGPLPEVLGAAAAEWCERPDPAAVADALVRVLTDRARGAALREAGLNRARTAPTWQESAAVVLRGYREAADEHG